MDEIVLLEEAQFYAIDVNVTRTITDTSIRQALVAAQQRGLREFVRDHQKALQRLADWVVRHMCAVYLCTITSTEHAYARVDIGL